MAGDVFARNSFCKKRADLAFLKSNDRISGEIKRMERRLIRFSADSMDKLYIEWEQMELISTQKEGNSRLGGDLSSWHRRVLRDRGFWSLSGLVKCNGDLDLDRGCDGMKCIRLNFDIRLRQELVNKGTRGISLYHVYDNQPTQGAQNDDYGIVPSLG